jgi:TetR/AcrR family transcriptional regulator
MTDTTDSAEPLDTGAGGSGTPAPVDAVNRSAPAATSVPEKPERRHSGAQTRRRLIEAARAAFSSGDYHCATTAEIAAAAGCSEPTLFKYFGSKQALLVAAIRDTGDSILAILDAPPPPGPATPFEAFAERARGLLFHPLLGEMSRLRSFALALALDDPEVRQAMAGIEVFEGRVAAAVAAGQASGEVRADVSPQDVAALAFAISLLFGFDSALEGDARAASRLSPLVDTLLTMLRAPERQTR